MAAPPPPNPQGRQASPGSVLPSEGAIFDSNDNQIEVVNTTTETDIYAPDIPANKLVIHNGVAIVVHGDYLNNSGGNARLRVRVYYGNTLLFNSRSPNLVNDVDLGAWTARFELRAQGGEYKLQRVEGLFKMSDRFTPTVGFGSVRRELFSGTVAGAATEDSQLSNLLRLSIEHDTAHASIRLRKYSAYAEYLK